MKTLLVLTLLTLTPFVAHADLAPGDSGWYVGLGSSAVHLDLDLGDAAGLGDAANRVDAIGQGGHLQVGYRFAEGFGLELKVVGSEHDAGTDAGVATFAQAHLDAVTWLLPGRRVQPWLAGGIGGAGLEFEGGPYDGSQLTGGQVDVGAGLDVRAAKHLDFGLHYRFAIQNYEVETLTGPAKAPVEIDGSGVSHTWGLQLRWVF